ncbi:MAG: radical SAM protein [archaeon]
MDVLLVIPKYLNQIEPLYDYPTAIGLSYISAALKGAKHNVKCLNLNQEKGYPRDILTKALDEKKYDIVATGGVATLYNMLEIILDTAKNHKSEPKTVLGGLIITTEPDLIFDALKPDIGVLGEGEKTIVELLDYLEKKKDLKKVNGIMYQTENGTVRINEKREVIQDLDTIPFPDMEGIGFQEQLDHMHTNFGYQTSIMDKPSVYHILTSRSCPFQCTFCYHDSHYRTRSIKNVMEELNQVIKKYKINILIIYDDCFAINKERIKEFCIGIKKIQSEIDWELKWHCQLMVSTVDKELLKTLKDAGCYMISYGFESYSPIVLKSMRKNITPEKIDFALKETIKAGINLQAHFIFGDIAETMETAKETLDYWKENCEGQVYLNLIGAYPGSYIYNYCVEKGLIKDKLDYIKNRVALDPTFNMTEKMTNGEYNKLKREVRSMKKYLYPTVPKSMKKEGFQTYSLKVVCPFCKKINEYKNSLIFKPWNFNMDILCRHCYKKYLITCRLHKIAFQHYSFFKPIIQVYNYILMNIGKRKMNKT